MAAKGLLALLMKGAPPPDKLGKRGGGSGVDDGGDPSDEGEGDEHEDGDSAALESAVADFFQAGRAGKYAEAAAAYKEMHQLCSDAELDGDDGYGE